MTTPHAPTAILLSHLQALYNIIILTFINAISLFLGHCRRHRCYCNSTTGRTGGRRRRRKRRSQRGRWPRGRLHCHSKIGSRDRGLVAERGSFESLTNVNHALCKVKYGASTERSTQLHIQMVAATNYKTSDTKRRTD